MLRPLLCCLVAALTAHAAYVPSRLTPPAPQREFRGAWVASVRNIDWPSKAGLTTAQQQAELLAILDRAEQIKLNVIALQVRPACDALYASKLEPWSEYLTGTMGKAPSPFWDPLEFAVREAHKRGIELHAWFNPFRARHTSAFSARSTNHISNTRPSLVKTYGKHLWLDPGLNEVHEHSLRVILDVATRYDVDGIHLDDYFYPYREKDSAGNLIPFPDNDSWSRYSAAGGTLSRDDWRRDNVNRFIARMYREVKSVRPWIKVGISPFGIYRPGHPEQIKGFDQYESIYADPRLWLTSGWLDYISPQLYWRIEPAGQSFPVLLNWWTQNNPKQRMIVPGINVTAVGAADPGRAWPVAEILRQVEITRTQRAAGHIHWNMGSLMRNKAGLADELARAPYASAATVPSLDPRSFARVGQPKLSARASSAGVRLNWSTTNATVVRFWVVQARRGDRWSTELLPRETTELKLASPPSAIAIRAMDKFGNLGTTAVIEETPRKR